MVKLTTPSLFLDVVPQQVSANSQLRQRDAWLMGTVVSAGANGTVEVHLDGHAEGESVVAPCQSGEFWPGATVRCLTDSTGRVTLVEAPLEEREPSHDPEIDLVESTFVGSAAVKTAEILEFNREIVEETLPAVRDMVEAQSNRITSEVEQAKAELHAADTALHEELSQAAADAAQRADEALAEASQPVTAEKIVASEALWAKIGTFAKVTTQHLLAGGAKIVGTMLADTIELSTRLIAGNPDGTHVELSGSGLKVLRKDPVHEAGTIDAIQLGVGDGGDYLTITDPSGTPKAALDENGIAAFQVVLAQNASFGDARVGGLDVVDEIRNRHGLVHVVNEPASKWIGSARKVAGSYYTPIEFAHTNTSGSLQYLTLDPLVASMYSFGASGVAVAQWWVREGDTSTTITQADKVAQSTVTIPANHAMNVTCPAYTYALKSGSTVRIRPAFSCSNQWNFEAKSTLNTALRINNTINPEQTDRFISNLQLLGAVQSPTSSTLKTYVKTYNATWGATYLGDWSQSTTYAPRIAWGNDPNGDSSQFSHALVGFPNIVSDLSGANVAKVEAYVQADYWHSPSGGTLHIGTHNALTAPETFSRGTALANTALSRPGSAWVTLPSSTYAGFKSGAIRGVGVFQPSNNVAYYGYGTPSNWKLRVTYVK